MNRTSLRSLRTLRLNPSAEFRLNAACGTGRASLRLLLVCAGLVLLLSFARLGTTIQIGADEGFELAKATLCLDGHRLYREVWNDQPPLHTFLLTQLLSRVSPGILGPRLLTAGFALVLLGAVFFIAKSVSGLSAATFAAILLLLSPGFVELGASCMLEIPALATATVGLCLLLRKGSVRWWTDLAAGAAFGMALQTKYIVAVYLPLAVLIIIARSRNGALAESASAVAIPLVLFGAGLLASFAVINEAIGGAPLWVQFRQSWASHFGGTQSFEYGAPAEHPFDWSVFLKHWDTVLPAMVGMRALAQRKHEEKLALLPLAWLALTLVVFGIHKPWWPYYYVHTAIPLCWCAGVGLEYLIRTVLREKSRLIQVVLALYLVGAGAWMMTRVGLQVQGIRHSPKTSSSLLLEQMAHFKPFTEFLYTGEPIYSFHAGIPLPPRIGIVPLKRLWSGDMTNARLAEELAATKPGLILLPNDTQEVPFQPLLESSYRLVYQDANHRLYARREVARAAGY